MIEAHSSSSPDSSRGIDVYKRQEYNNKIYLSARSIDEVNVQLIMERLGGGGHMNIAGAQLTGYTMEQAIEYLKNTLDQMIEEGAL